jgi:outer membrane lipoprotein-sorting protein
VRTGAAVLLISAGLAACSAPPRAIRERNLGSDEVLALVTARNRQITTLRGDGSITIESPERSNNGGFDLNLRKPDSVRVDFHGPFGIKVGTLMLARNQFVFYNALDNKAMIGEPDGATLGAMFNLTLRFDEILNAFTGEFGQAATGDTLARFTVENGDYVMLYRGAAGTREYRVDGDAFVVTSYRAVDAAGAETIRASASEIEFAGATAMPRLLRVVFPAERRSITIAYDDVKVNERVDCAYELPDQAQIMHRQ